MAGGKQLISTKKNDMRPVQVNEVTLDGKLWPRGAAFGERLWLNPIPAETKSPTVYARLLHHNERMRRRGIRVDTRQPKSCLLINGNCENKMEAPKGTLSVPTSTPAVQFIQKTL